MEKVELLGAGSSAFGDEDEGVAVAQGNMFLLRLDEFVLFPFAQDAADVVDIGACHFCQILARECHVDEDAFVYSFAKLACQAQEGLGDALFDALGCHFLVAVLQPGEAIGDEFHAVEGDFGVLEHEALGCFGVPTQGLAIFDGFGGGGVVHVAESHDDAESIAQPKVVEDDLVTIDVDLGEASLPTEEDVKTGGGFPLVKEITALGDVMGTAVINKILAALRLYIV